MPEAFEGLSVPIVPASDAFSSMLQFSISALHDCREQQIVHVLIIVKDSFNLHDI